MTNGLVRPRNLPAQLPATLHELLGRSVARAPGQLAIAMRHEQLTYAQFDARVVAMASSLVAAGAGKGTRIALLAPDGILWATAFFAATRIGAVVIAISTLASAPELAHIVRHSDAQMLIGVRRFLRHEYGERLEAAFPGLRETGGGPLMLPEVPFLRKVWLDDAEGLGWAATHEDLMAEPGPGAALVEAMRGEVVGSDDAVVIYTSGTSSLPKAVIHTQGSAARQSMVLARYFKMKPTDRLMPLLPAFWVGGLTMLTEVLGTGGTLVYPGTPAIDDVVGAVRMFDVNRINSWGPQTEKIRAGLAAQGIDPDAIGGLAPTRTDEGELVPPGRGANMLGMTESFGPHSAEPTGDMLEEARAGASGRATSDYERRIVDPETGEVLGIGRSGELQLRRGGLMRGFYKVDPDRVFTPDGFYPTGDTARIDEAGYLYFEGRRSDMMKTGGVNVSRLEVEAALRLSPEVALPIVLPLPDRAAGQIVVAAVVAREGTSPDEESLKAGLRDQIANYKVPRRILVIDEQDIEWTPSNKIKFGEMARLIAARIGHESAA